ncbi:hypothetical protein AAFC00_002615 [Neodothiora populina]|uniref:C2H2-type domain-containing protein n=1 Tax=Neodothiora populina TaxID=2781224 RepID=A0ABR3P7S9_9PEZI
MDSQYQPGSYMPMTSTSQQGQYAPFPAYSSHHHHHHHHQQQQQQQQHPHPQQQQPSQQQQSSQPPPSQQQSQQQQQQQQEAARENSTLPPLHTQAGGFNQLPSLYSGSGSHPHTPTNASTPATSSMPSSTLHSFSHHSSPATSGSMLPPSSSYAPYSTTQPGMSAAATTTATSGSALAPTPAQNRLPDLRPIMPQASYNSSLSGLPSFGASSGLASGQSYMASQDPEPTHVVGSQGRRGILPSAPGRAAAPTAGTTAASTKSMIPAKDADGKFPCPHCNKTYLHAKHLKRHLLRHTGDRPYMCHLCKDTFSRSDILKRHFQKCSIRRGNPTGANHLAHQRRNTNSNRLSVSSTEPIGLANIPEVAGQPYTNGTSINGVQSSPTVNGDHSSYASSVASMSGRSTRANSLIHPGAMNGENRHSLSGMNNSALVSGAPNGERIPTSAAGFGSSISSYGMRPHSISNPMPPSYTFSGLGSHVSSGGSYPSYVKAEDHAPNGYTHQAPPIQDSRSQANGVGPDWSSMFAPNGQDGFMTQSQQAASHAPVKAEAAMDGQNFNGHAEGNNENFFSGLYSNPSTFGEDSGAHHLSGFSNWNMDLLQSDPLQSKANALLTYVFSNRTSSSDDASDEMKRCLTVDNIKHFIEQFTSFQGHWPLIHMPTFDIFKANESLVLAIICIGAVYSEKRDVYQVRKMMELVNEAVKTSSRVYMVTSGLVSEGESPLGTLQSDLEEFQACSLLITLFVWHGNPAQRALARQEFGQIVAISRRMGLTEPAPPGHPSYSSLHHPGQILQGAIPSWNWLSWVVQETRSRIMFSIVLLDAALVMFFNTQPHVDHLEIRLPLPADDAAWDAKSSEECRDVIGLMGSSAQFGNVSGSQRLRQPDMRSAMRSLMDPTYTFQPRSTNAYSKFILIHALNVQACKVQRANVSVSHNPAGVLGSLSAASSGPNTPLAQHDWIAQDGSGSSGTATPPEITVAQNTHTHNLLKTIHLAMSKWKTMWDVDINIQYPPHTVEQRFGFSRDGIHFYYLGQSFMRSTKASDWTAPPDVRFMQVMTLLKKIKGFVVNDNYQNGQDTGSIGKIDDTYGIGDLTLDMKLLFRPLGSNDSPVVGLRTDIL